jgi:hypothetical protein
MDILINEVGVLDNISKIVRGQNNLQHESLNMYDNDKNYL